MQSNGTPETFNTCKDLRQGDAISRLLLNIAVEKVTRDAELDIRGIQQRLQMM